jgi:cyclopropane fatty-acyl-phospholipid synthase-like methyltransferase
MDNQREGEDFFYGVYRASNEVVLAKIRRETCGEDLGQFSWITADELRKFFRKLDLDIESRVLDVACGSGGPALFTAQTLGCQVTGLDIDENGIDVAKKMTQARGLQSRANFEHGDASQPLPFPDASFDAVISIDAMNHFSHRAEVFAEWLRVLRPGGRFLFTDAVIVTGMLSRDEILARSRSMGHFLFTPSGLHERLIEAAGFVELQVEDVTDTIATVSKRWHDAREKHRSELLKTETQADFEGLQNMLAVAHTLASGRRLSRFAYSASKAGATRVGPAPLA